MREPKDLIILLMFGIILAFVWNLKFICRRKDESTYEQLKELEKAKRLFKSSFKFVRCFSNNLMQSIQLKHYKVKQELKCS